MNTVGSEPIAVMPVACKHGAFALRICLNQGELSIGRMKNVMDVRPDTA